MTAFRTTNSWTERVGLVSSAALVAILPIAAIAAIVAVIEAL